MGRPRSNYECPKCKQPGYKELNASRNGNYPNSKYRKYWRVVHYDSITKKKSFCYIDHILYVLENKEQILELNRKLNTLSPTEMQEEYLRILKEHRENRARMRLEKQVFKEVESKFKNKIC